MNPSATTETLHSVGHITSMKEHEVIKMEDGTRICPSCIVGELKYNGGPVGNQHGLRDILDPDTVWLFKCDVCGSHYRQKSEEDRQRLIDELAFEYCNKYEEWRDYFKAV